MKSNVFSIELFRKKMDVTSFFARARTPLRRGTRASSQSLCDTIAELREHLKRIETAIKD